MFSRTFLSKNGQICRIFQPVLQAKSPYDIEYQQYDIIAENRKNPSVGVRVPTIAPHAALAAGHNAAFSRISGGVRSPPFTKIPESQHQPSDD